MKYMQDIMMRLVDVPLARMFVLASIIFLLLAVLGKIEGKIEPGKMGRIGAIIVGVILLTVGLAMHFNETDALRDRLRESVSASLSAPTQALSSTPDGSMVRLAMATPGGALAADETGANEKTGMRWEKSREYPDPAVRRTGPGLELGGWKCGCDC